jgi:hypothetical protein
MPTHVPHRPPPSPPPPFPQLSNSPSRQLNSRPKSAYGTQPTHPRSSSSPPTSGPAPANASTSTSSTPRPSETSTSPKRTSTPKHGSQSLPTPRARSGCALNTIWPPVGPLFVVVVGFGLNVTADVRTEIGRNMTRTIDLDIDIGADAVDYKYVPLRAAPFARPVHLPPPASSPIKNLPESRRRCENWKDSSKRSWVELNYLKNGKTDSPALIVRLSSSPSFAHTPCSRVSLASLDESARAQLNYVCHAYECGRSQSLLDGFYFAR